MPKPASRFFVCCQAKQSQAWGWPERRGMVIELLHCPSCRPILFGGQRLLAKRQCRQTRHELQHSIPFEQKFASWYDKRPHTNKLRGFFFCCIVSFADFHLNALLPPCRDTLRPGYASLPGCLPTHFSSLISTIFNGSIRVCRKFKQVTIRCNP